MAENQTWCFAYGSNLNMNQMRDRIGEWSDSKIAIIRGYRLVFNVKSQRWGGLAANIMKSNNTEDRVYGAIYRIQKKQLDQLTRFEGTEPQDINVESVSNSITAKIYVFDTSRKPGKPPDCYLEAMITGLKQHGYSKEIIKNVKKAADL